MPERIVDSDTDLVIEGFPRCANSFLEAAFHVMQRGVRYRVVHHTHAPAPVLKAVQLRVPTAVVFRNPVDAVSSLLLHHPGVFTIRSAFAEFVSFYTALQPYWGEVVLSPFEVTTSEPQRVIAELNARYGAAFRDNWLGKADEEAAFRLVDLLTEERVGSVDDHYSPFFDETYRRQRRERRQRIGARVALHRSAERLRAERLFEQLLGNSSLLRGDRS